MTFYYSNDFIMSTPMLIKIYNMLNSSMAKSVVTHLKVPTFQSKLFIDK